MTDAAEVLRVEGVSHCYSTPSGSRRVLHDVSLTVAAGRTVAVVGESGAGKSTLTRLVAGLERPTDGTVKVAGRAAAIRPGVTSAVQMNFQHPTEALNRFISVGANIEEGLRHLPRQQRAARVAELLEQVGISPERAGDKSRSFSGGQLQRIVIARALAAEPQLLLCDEPTSALDVSVQAQIVNLLLAIQERDGFGCMLVTHDLGVARVLADDILVLRNGEVAEYTHADRFFEGPSSEYGRTLLRTTEEQMLMQPPAPVADPAECS
jgi:ABC-type dipeptide/oligopeptide/nickel transport system ATPase subunit